MQILFHAHDEPLPDTFPALVESTVRNALRPYEERLTRIEVHLRDLNGNKGGVDKRCVIEARPRGLDPVVADHESDKVNLAFHGALEKLQRVLDKRFGRLAARDGRP